MAACGAFLTDVVDAGVADLARPTGVFEEGTSGTA